jgi:dihydroflavonol-4-reductase
MAPVRLHVPRVYPRVAIRLLGVLGSVGAVVTRRPPKLTVALADLACRDQFYTNAKARRKLGFEPRPIEKAVRDALAWFAEQGYMKR